MTLNLKRSVVAATLALVCTVGLGSAQAANLLATENGDSAGFVADANWFIPFTSTSMASRRTETA